MKKPSEQLRIFIAGLAEKIFSYGDEHITVAVCAGKGTSLVAE